jgi:asparagine synthase (glutamine-hydrolysing)
MPGLWGLVSEMPTDELASRFAAMGRSLQHHEFYRSQIHRDDGGALLGRMSLGFVNTEPQPAWNEDGSLLAMMEGEIYDAAALRRTLVGAGHRFWGEGQAEVLLHGYEQEGRDFFRRLDGSFTAAIWDGRRRRLILAGDRFGMKPLYFAHLPGRLLFAPEIKALLADPDLPRAPSVRGMAQLFTFGHLMAEDTLLDAVALLPAAGWMTYDAAADRLEVERYWRAGPGTAVPRPATTAEALDRFDEAFARAVERRVEDTEGLGISLSGGLDSRTILAAIDTRAHPLTAVSLGLEGSIDVRSASRMAEILDIPHHRCQLDAEFLRRFEDHMRRMVHLTDGHYLCQCIVMPTLPLYRELGIRVLLRGHAGELLHMDKAYNYSIDGPTLRLRDPSALEDWLYRRLRTYMLEATDGPLFAPEYQNAMEDLARETLRDCFAESRDLEPPVHRIWHMFLSQRLRRETAMSMVEFGSLVETRLPFLDNELIDLIFATPPELKMGEAIQAHILRRRRPEFLRVANANTGTRVGAGRLERSISKFRLKVLAKLGVRGFQPYERLGLWLRQDLRPMVERVLLDDRCLGRGVFNPETVESVVRQHAEGKRNHTFLLMALMIYEQGQRQFVDGEPALC